MTPTAFDLYALLDPDGDELFTWQEWVAGTDPTNGLSSLRLVDALSTTNGRLLRDEWHRTTDSIPEHLVVDDSLDTSRPNPWELAGHAFPKSHNQE